ncbi:hypothetical protein [Mycolicibacterium celeriflavum]|uniref:Uncharacterized protein n=1 Tax=Mycolicibacterium celeriflavum TaxID=1249101 RepID=A0A7I7RF70_MYCCF|nr:hypothetical protein [Mycolicibacterium celeriflavum]MCV7239498.1 hypothetical protein [Mycolicibacterium celeriflavum]BBY43188.1 hypothetical protein MCEL_14830 [Mycolicibacterium celeriflavum]
MPTRLPTRPFADDFVLADPAPAADGRINQHQLIILAASLADVVGMAGGWLFDRARAGWDVTVRVEGCRDLRPLMILGANVVDESTETVLCDLAPGSALAVSAELLSKDSRVHARVLELVKSGDVEVMAWGEVWPEQLGGQVDATEHRLSVAACAFKARALAAAELAPAVSATETLFDLGAESSSRPLCLV